VTVPARGDQVAAESGILPMMVGKKPAPRKKATARKRKTGT
jgi:hypothetical protein